MLEPEVCWKQMHSIEESSLHVTLLGLSGALHSDSAPWELFPWPPRNAPVSKSGVFQVEK